MKDEIFNELKNFIIKRHGLDHEEVTRSSRVDADLGIYGDEAVEFIIDYGSRFDVDVSKFMASEYFEPEGDVILPAIIGFITNRKKASRKTLTVEHLEKAIIAGRLDEEVITSFNNY